MSRSKKVTTRHPNALSGFVGWLLAIVSSLAMVLLFAPVANAGGPSSTQEVTLPQVTVECQSGQAMFYSEPGLPGRPYTVDQPLWNNGTPSTIVELDWAIFPEGLDAGWVLPNPMPSHWTDIGMDNDGNEGAIFYYDCNNPEVMSSPDVPPSTTPPTTPPPTTPPSSSLPENVSRIAGTNRYATAAAIASRFGTANAVVIANGESVKEGVDALSANYLAGRVGAPILLAQATKTDSGTLSAAKTVLKGSSNPTIYVMGGKDSVSDAVVAQLKSAAASVSSGTVAVKRIAGPDRYATSALVAESQGAVENSLSFGGNTMAKTAILASGETNADALAAGPLSYAWGIPVLLTPDKMAQQVTFSTIQKLGITQLIVLGGTDRVSPTVLSRLSDAGIISVKRIAGADRYDTAAQLYSYAADVLRDKSGNHYGVNGSIVYLANGDTGFPDALSVGPLVGKNGNVLLTTSPTKLGAPALSFIKAHDQFTSVVGLGSASTVSNSVLITAGKAVG